MSEENSKCSLFIKELEKRGFFDNCTPQQRELKEQLAQHYFNQHYDSSAVFVSSPKSEEKKEKSDEMKTRENEAEELKNKGNSYLSEKNYNKAIECYTQAIELKKSAIYYSNRASSYLSIGQYESALNDCKESIKLDPNYAKAYARMSSVLVKMSKLKEAKEAIENALKIDPKNELYLKNLEQIKYLIEEESNVQNAHQQSTQNAQNNQNAQSNQQQANPNGMFGMNFSGQGMEGLMGMVSSMLGGANGGGLRDMVQGFMNNSQMLNMIAQMTGMSPDQLREEINREMNGSNNQTNGQSNTQNPPPGYA